MSLHEIHFNFVFQVKSIDVPAFRPLPLVPPILRKIRTQSAGRALVSLGKLNFSSAGVVTSNSFPLCLPPNI
jgi:hypothetical protein